MHSPGMCSTCMPRSSMHMARDCIIWHQHESSKSKGWIPAGAVLIYGLRTTSIHFFIIFSCFHAFSCTVYTPDAEYFGNSFSIWPSGFSLNTSSWGNMWPKAVTATAANGHSLCRTCCCLHASSSCTSLIKSCLRQHFKENWCLIHVKIKPLILILTNHDWMHSLNEIENLLYLPQLEDNAEIDVYAMNKVVWLEKKMAHRMVLGFFTFVIKWWINLPQLEENAEIDVYAMNKVVWLEKKMAHRMVLLGFFTFVIKWWIKFGSLGKHHLDRNEICLFSELKNKP